MPAGDLSDPRRSGTVPAPPDDMREHVRAAYAMLCDANKRAIQVPADVVTVITTARKAASAELPPDLEARFWNAYGLLSSSIKPAEHARRFYRWVFYCVLASLLLFQFVYTAGDHLRTKLADVEKQIVDVRGRAATPPSQQAAGTPAAASAALTPESADAVTRQLQQSRIAYHRLSADLVAFVSKPIDWIGGFDEFYSTRRSLAARRGDDSEATARESEAHYTDVKARLDLILAFLGAYLLPMLYGLLGACAFVLRKLSDEIDKLTYAHDARVRYALRLNIGLLSGLAVGWFVKPGAGEPNVASLSPLALAFIAGYGSELFFVALDRLVQAFAPTQGAATTTVRETTAGGITATETTTVEKVVAGLEGDGAPPRAIVDPRGPTPISADATVGKAA
jgi:hypothetical protein